MAGRLRARALHEALVDEDWPRARKLLGGDGSPGPVDSCATPDRALGRKLLLGDGSASGSAAEGCATPDHAQRLPLHLAIQFRAPLEVVALVAASWPEACAVAVERREGRPLPLAMAAELEAPLEVQMLLLAFHPAAAQPGRARELCRALTTDGDTALHVAARHAAVPTANVKELLGLSPAAARTTNAAGQLPLHLALESSTPAVVDLLREASGLAEALVRHDWDAIRRFGLATPRACAANAHDGCTPLHDALFVHDAPEAIVEAIVQAHPRACATRQAEGKLLLHKAIETAARLDALPLLLRANAAACLEPDEHQELPLHLAIRRKLALETIELLVATRPQACAVPDRAGLLPLQLGIRHAASPKAIEVILRASPGDVCARPDRHGSLPLHDAIVFKSSSDVVSLLLAAHPTAATVGCAVGGQGQPMLPLDLALQRGAGRKVTEAIYLAADPAAKAAAEQGEEEEAVLPLNWLMLYQHGLRSACGEGAAAAAPYSPSRHVLEAAVAEPE